MTMNSFAMRDFNGSLSASMATAGAADVTNDANDEARMEQIRELLHGELRRQHEARIAALELKIREMEAGFAHQLDVMNARIEALSAEMMNVRREQLDELARGFVDMGERVKRLTSRE